MDSEVFRALRFAASAHKGQTRKGSGLPYIIHPIAVVELLVSSSYSLTHPVILVAGALHDVCEDAPVLFDEVGRAFGIRVEMLVRELTKVAFAARVNLTKEQKDFINESYAAAAGNLSPEAQIIKVCDRCHNLSDGMSMEPTWQKRYVADSEVLLKNLKNCPDDNLLAAAKGQLFVMKNSLMPETKP